MAKVDQEGEILLDGKLYVYVAFCHEKKNWLSALAYGLIMLLAMVLIVEKHNFLALVGMDKQFQSFISGLAIHLLTILQNQWMTWIQFFVADKNRVFPI